MLLIHEGAFRPLLGHRDAVRTGYVSSGNIVKIKIFHGASKCCNYFLRETVSCYQSSLSKRLLQPAYAPIHHFTSIVQVCRRLHFKLSQHLLSPKIPLRICAKKYWREGLASHFLKMSAPLRTVAENGAKGKGPVEARSAVGTRVERMERSSLHNTGATKVGAGCGIIQDLPEWASSRIGQRSPPKLLTLVIVHKDDRVLLGMKKRGFGKGYYNGFGGKVEKGETIDNAAARELQEESGVMPLDMSKRGILTFHFDSDPVPWEVHVYHVSEIIGEPYETEEMEPRWFSVSEIPYESMWSDDVIWYPEFLQGRQFQGDFYFENTTTLVAHSLRRTNLP